MAIDIDLYKNGMRRLAGGVCIITTIGTEGAPSGFTATAVCSVTVDPPTLLVCANRTNTNHDMMHAAGFFAVNVLPEHERKLADRFATNEDKQGRFAEGTWSFLPSGVPVLDSALGWFECRMTQHLVMGTHGVFFGIVDSAKVSESDMMPLLYFQGAYGTVAALSAAP